MNEMNKFETGFLLDYLPSTSRNQTTRTHITQEIKNYVWPQTSVKPNKKDEELERLKAIFQEFYTEGEFPRKNEKKIEKEENPPLFNVENFLQELPYPVEVYEHPDRKCNYNLTMFELFKNHFRKLKITTISDTYTRSAFNAVKTFNLLTNMKIEIKKSRKKSSINLEDSTALQEFNFLLNQKAIKNCIREKKEKDEQMLQRMIDNNELLECECCCEEILLPASVISCAEGHVFCRSCAIKGTDEELSKGVCKIKCFAECSSELNLHSLQKILNPEKFKILLSKVQELEIISANIEGLVSCPFCHFASIPPEDETIFQCLNLDCLKETCRLCKKLNHLPKECENIEKNKKARLILEESMTKALVRKCHKCGREIIKEGGCNNVTCICGNNICYFCGQSTRSHEHLNGSCNGTITSDTDASGVAYVARAVKDQLLRLDPNLKIDVDSILPSVSTSFQNQNLAVYATQQLNTIPEL